MIAEAAGAAWLAEALAQPRFVATRHQIQMQGRFAVARDRVAQQGRQRVDQAALDAGGGDHAFALLGLPLAVGVAPVSDHRLERAAGETAGQMIAPVDVEAAVGRLQWRDIDAACGKQRHPAAIGAQFRPTAAAHREHHGIGFDPGLAVRMGETQAMAILPAEPAMLHVEANPLLAQPSHPAAQQGRRLEIAGKHAPRAADESVHAQPGGPAAQGVGVEPAQPVRHRGLAGAIAGDEEVEGIGMGQVQSALAGDQELAPDRALGVVEIHLQPGRAQPFGGEQAGRPSADDGDACGGTSGWGRRGG